MVYCQRNELTDVERHTIAAQERRHVREPLSIAQNAFVLASIHQARSMCKEARLVLDSLNQYVRESHRDALLPLVRAFDTEFAARQGDLDTAGR